MYPTEDSLGVDKLDESFNVAFSFSFNLVNNGNTQLATTSTSTGYILDKGASRWEYDAGGGAPVASRVVPCWEVGPGEIQLV